MLYLSIKDHKEITCTKFTIDGAVRCTWQAF